MKILETKRELLYQYHVADFFIRNNVMQAGYKGPASTLVVNNYNIISNHHDEQIIPLAPIAVCNPIKSRCKNFVTNKILHKIASKQIKTDSDILIIYDIPYKVGELEYSMEDPSVPLIVSTDLSNYLQKREQLIIADLECSQRFIVSNVATNKLFHAKPENDTEDLIKAFKSGSEVFWVKHLAFYLAKDSKSKADIYNLYMDYLMPEDRYAQAIIENVNNLKVKVISSKLQERRLEDASQFGWVCQKYILVQLSFIKHDKVRSFAIGVELRNV